MRWRRSRRSSNVEDRRGSRGGGFGFPRPRTRMGRVARGGGIGGVGIIIVVVASLFFGVDPSILLQGGGGFFPTEEASFDSGNRAALSAEEQEMGDFVAAVLGETEDVWGELFPKQFDKPYQQPKLVLFRDVVHSACGQAQSAMGPFYCPGDQKIYIDLSFFRDLRQRFRAPGDFAQAYVIAHEVGHHIQTLMGITQQVHEFRQRLSKTEYNRLSVRMELQADCLSGVWANNADRARNILEAGDIDEALNAASAIGDDRIQQSSTGRVAPDSFTHGSSEQRVRWFQQGLKHGNVRACDTFNAERL